MKVVYTSTQNLNFLPWEHPFVNLFYTGPIEIIDRAFVQFEEREVMMPALKLNSAFRYFRVKHTNWPKYTGSLPFSLNYTYIKPSSNDNMKKGLTLTEYQQNNELLVPLQELYKTHGDNFIQSNAGFIQLEDQHTNDFNVYNPGLSLTINELKPFYTQRSYYILFKGIQINNNYSRKIIVNNNSRLYIRQTDSNILEERFDVTKIKNSKSRKNLDPQHLIRIEKGPNKKNSRKTRNNRGPTGNKNNRNTQQNKPSDMWPKGRYRYRNKRGTFRGNNNNSRWNTYNQRPPDYSNQNQYQNEQFSRGSRGTDRGRSRGRGGRNQRTRYNVRYNL